MADLHYWRPSHTGSSLERYTKEQRWRVEGLQGCGESWTALISKGWCVCVCGTNVSAVNKIWACKSLYSVFVYMLHSVPAFFFFFKPTNKKKMTAIIYYCLICLYLFSFLCLAVFLSNCKKNQVLAKQQNIKCCVICQH